MRIVLLGATGFLGHYVLPALSGDGHHCLALTRYRPGCRDLTVLPRVTVAQQGKWDADALSRRFEGADAVGGDTSEHSGSKDLSVPDAASVDAAGRGSPPRLDVG